MITPQVFMGLGIFVMCAVGLVNERWLLSNSRRGQRLAEKYGRAKAQWIVRTVFGVGAIFGGALAAGLVNPVDWN